MIDPDEAFRQLARVSLDGMALVEDGRYLFANDPWARLLELENPSVLEGTDFLRHTLEEDRPTITAWLDNPLSEEEHRFAEYRFLGAGGHTRFLQLTRISFGGEEGVVGLMARDVTRNKREQARLLLADRMMSVGALAAGTAHEINNPLTYVQGNIGFAVEELKGLVSEVGGQRVEELLEALEEAQEGAERVRLIVRRLHAFARSDQHELRTVDVTRVVEDAVNMAYTEIRHRARLEKALDPNLFVHANEARLGQVVLNLLLNAAHALPEGQAERNFIRIEGMAVDGRILVKVIDSGPGIPAEIVGRVFDPFFTTKPVGIGTGLGLSIANSIVTELGGRIQVESELGKGTAFAISLPGLAGETDVTDDLPTADFDADARATILIVDDEPLIAAALRRALRDHYVEVAPNGRVAIELLQSKPAGFDLVFCDLMMPELTGMDVYEWVSEHQPGVERNFVFMTGGIFTPRAQAFLEKVSNRNQSIEKPFDLERVRRFVNGRLARRTPDT